jgi:hypothetical protein
VFSLYFAAQLEISPAIGMVDPCLSDEEVFLRVIINVCMILQVEKITGDF